MGTYHSKRKGNRVIKIKIT